MIKQLLQVDVELLYQQCSKEFFGTYIEEMYRSGVDVMNVEGTQLGDAIVNRAVSRYRF